MYNHLRPESHSEYPLSVNIQIQLQSAPSSTLAQTPTIPKGVITPSTAMSRGLSAGAGARFSTVSRTAPVTADSAPGNRTWWPLQATARDRSPSRSPLRQLTRRLSRSTRGCRGGASGKNRLGCQQYPVQRVLQRYAGSVIVGKWGTVERVAPVGRKGPERPAVPLQAAAQRHEPLLVRLARAPVAVFPEVRHQRPGGLVGASVQERQCAGVADQKGRARNEARGQDRHEWPGALRDAARAPARQPEVVAEDAARVGEAEGLQVQEVGQGHAAGNFVKWGEAVCKAYNVEGIDHAVWPQTETSDASLGYQGSLPGLRCRAIRCTRTDMLFHRSYGPRGVAPLAI